MLSTPPPFFKNAETELIDVSKLELPIFSVDKEYSDGIHPIALDFAIAIDKTDFIILSLAENNGSYNAGFKNLMDWTSQIKDRKTWGGKPILLLSTSPGGRGGATVLEGARNYLPYLGAKIVGTFSLPHFYQNFDEQKGIIESELLKRFKEVIQSTGIMEKIN